MAHTLYIDSSLVQLNKKCCNISDFLLETTSQASEDNLLLKRSVIIKLCNVFIAGTHYSYCSLSWCKRQILPRSKHFDPTILQPSSDKCLDIIRAVFEKYPDIGYLKSAQLSGYRILDISRLDTLTKTHLHEPRSGMLLLARNSKNTYPEE